MILRVPSETKERNESAVNESSGGERPEQSRGVTNIQLYKLILSHMGNNMRYNVLRATALNKAARMRYRQKHQLLAILGALGIYN